MKAGKELVVASVYHADLNEAQGDAALARALAAMPPDGPFDRLEWFGLLGEICLPDTGSTLAVVRSGDSALALPLMAAGPRQLASLANWYSFWWRPVGDSSLLPAIARSIGRHADAIRLSAMPEAEAMTLASAFRGNGWAAFMRPCDVNHYLPVTGRSFAQYWTTRPGRLRETVRRKARKDIVSLTISDRFDPAHWEAYEAVYRLSWKPGEGSPEFLRRFAEAESARGRLRLAIATIAGRPVAAQMWTVEAGTAFIHKLAHDETAKKHSPGTLLSAALFEHVIDRDKVSEIDFGTGNDPYKRDWMEAVRQRYAVDLYRLVAPAVWPGIVRASIKRALGR